MNIKTVIAKGPSGYVKVTGLVDENNILWYNGHAYAPEGVKPVDIKNSIAYAVHGINGAEIYWENKTPDGIVPSREFTSEYV